MKIGKLTRWILVVGVIAVALIWLSGNIIRQRAVQNELNTEIAISGEQLAIITTDHQQKLVEYAAQKDELEDILGQPVTPISDFIAIFESPGKSIEFDEYIYEDAYQSDVTILTIKTALPQEKVYQKVTVVGQKITLITYETSSIDITATGEVVALLNFLDKLSARFQASYINQVTIKVPEERYKEEEKEEEETTATEAEKAIIEINLEIYAYEADNA